MTDKKVTPEGFKKALQAIGVAGLVAGALTYNIEGNFIHEFSQFFLLFGALFLAHGYFYNVERVKEQLDSQDKYRAKLIGEIKSVSSIFTK